MEQCRDTSRRQSSRARQHFTELCQQAVTEINLALGHDEQDLRNHALVSYEKGSRLIEEALSITLTDSDQSAELTSKREKMMSTLAHAQSRIRHLSLIQPGSNLPPSRQSALPTYEEAVSPSEPCAGSTATCNADILLEMSTAQIFYIQSDGFVSSPSYPSPLRICRFPTQTIADAPQHFIQIGTFALPLVHQLTPALHIHDGAYILPDVTSTQPGAAVGITLDDNTPAEHVRLFESLIKELTALRSSRVTISDTGPSPDVNVTCPLPARQPPPRPNQPPAALAVSTLPATTSSTVATSSSDVNQGQVPGPPATRLSTKIGKGLTMAAEWMSWGLGKGAEGAAGIVSYSGVKIRSNIQPPIQESAVAERYRNGVVKARHVTHQAVVVSSFLVKALGDMTVKLGQAAAPYVKCHARSLLPEKITKEATARDDTGRSKMDDLAEVAGAGIRGFGLVYLSLEEAGKALARTLTTQTSATMSLKYGQQYGEVTEHAMYAVGNTLLSAHNVSHLGPKAIAKRAVKDTAKQMVTESRLSETDETKADPQNTDVVGVRGVGLDKSI